MVARLTDSIMSIDPEQAIFLKRRGVQTVCSIERDLWLTQEGLADDIILSRGECVTLRGRGRIAVQSFSGRAMFRVRYPESIITWVRRAGSQLLAFWRRRPGGDLPHVRGD